MAKGQLEADISEASSRESDSLGFEGGAMTSTQDTSSIISHFQVQSSQAVINHMSQTPTEQYGVHGRIEVIGGKKFLIRPSMRLDKSGKLQEFAQKVPILSLEVNGEVVEVLGLPLESMAMTPEQQRLFEIAGGLMNESALNCGLNGIEDKMLYWIESFERQKSEIDGVVYTGFELFQKVYAEFPDIRDMTQDQAIQEGLYPNFYCRNFAARKGMAENFGGHVPILKFDRANNTFVGELLDIYNATSGETKSQKLAATGQAPFGWFYYRQKIRYNLGHGVILASGTLNPTNLVNTVSIDYNNEQLTFDGFIGQEDAVCSIIVLNK